MWLAYAFDLGGAGGGTAAKRGLPAPGLASVIKLFDVKTGKGGQVSQEEGFEQWRDSSPSFSPEGDYLFFVSARDVNPVSDALSWSNGYAFTNSERPYVLALNEVIAFESSNSRPSV